VSIFAKTVGGTACCFTRVSTFGPDSSSAPRWPDTPKILAPEPAFGTHSLLPKPLVSRQFPNNGRYCCAAGRSIGCSGQIMGRHGLVAARTLLDSASPADYRPPVPAIALHPAPAATAARLRALLRATGPAMSAAAMSTSRNIPPPRCRYPTNPFRCQIRDLCNPYSAAPSKTLCVRLLYGAIGRPAYFNCVEIEVNVVLSLVPRPFTTVMMAMEMPAAIRPYSMAVAPDSSLRKALSVFMGPADSTAAVRVWLLRPQKGPGRCSIQPGQGL
jgi:hypothetical protein